MNGLQEAPIPFTRWVSKETVHGDLDMPAIR